MKVFSRYNIICGQVPCGACDSSDSIGLVYILKLIAWS